MARLPRFAVAGQPHLVIQRGDAARPAFADDLDRRRYVELLGELARVSPLAVHAYALTDAEVELLVTPSQPEALGRFMQRVGRRYVAEFHARHGTHGALWPARFQSAAIDPEHYLLPCIQYVEQAPVRAGAVAQASEWPWSSAQHHIGARRVAWLKDHPDYWRLGNTPFEREARHEVRLQQLLDEAAQGEFQKAARGGWPLGSAAFVATVAQSTERPVRPHPRGRPGARPPGG
jgi:putative transposase